MPLYNTHGSVTIRDQAGKVTYIPNVAQAAAAAQHKAGNYLLHTDRGSFILTLYEKRAKPEDLPFFIGLMEHLAAKGLSCPTPGKCFRGPHVRMGRRPLPDSTAVGRAIIV